MNTYKVMVMEEQGGYLYINAKTAEQAEAKADKYLENNGIDDKVDVTHRSYEVIGTPEVVK